MEEKSEPKKVDLKRKEMFINFLVFVKEFKNETDRAAAVLGAAKLDYLLYKIFIKYLLPNTTGQDELFEANGPLSTFSAKINLAYRAGLINRQFAHALHLIRKIRNSFAHEVSGCSLDSGAHCDRIKELVAPFEAHKSYIQFKESYFGDKKGPRSDFYTMLGILVVRLESLHEYAKPLSDKYAWPPILKISE